MPLLSANLMNMKYITSGEQDVFHIITKFLESMCAHGKATKALNLRGLMSLNWNGLKISSDKIKNESAKSVDSSTRARLSCAASGTSRNWTV
jgi:hypothetical protein